MGTYFGPNGKKVTGQKMSGGGHSEALWEIEIATAVGRCERGGSARDEMAKLFKRFPQLKEERWEVGKHPMSPLIEWFTKQALA